MLAVTDKQAIHVHLHPIQLVGRVLLLPHHLRHEAEHPSAIRAAEAILDPERPWVLHRRLEAVAGFSQNDEP